MIPANISSRLGRLRSFVGIDRAIFYTLLSRGWSIIAGPVSLFFVARFLSSEEQGFFYTFSSVLALQVFFELGLAYVIMQCVSHEKAHLEWTDGGTLEGDPTAKARLASLFRLALKWYSVVAVLAVAILIPIGYSFFGRYGSAQSTISWQIPWLLVVSVTGLNLVLTPFYGTLEGAGKVAEIAALSVWQAVCGSLVLWTMMGLHCKLYATPALAFVSVIVATAWLLRKRRGFFADLFKTPIPPGVGVKWREEILPFQWKISLSWLSGYFIFQLSNPVMFRYHGPVEAGRMGMSLRIVDSIATLAFSWVSTKSSPFGNLIAKKDFATLDRTYAKAFYQSVSVALLGAMTVLGAYFFLEKAGFSYINRVVDPLSLFFLLGNMIINCIIFNQATYLRAHKKEPFLFNSLLGAVMVPLIMFFLGRPYGTLGISAGLFCGGLLVGLPLATLVFRKKSVEWHATLENGTVS